MRTVATLILLGAFGGLHAADPPQQMKPPDIPRRIVAEPKYAERPAYALLVFGQRYQDRVWLVADGERAYYVDRNGNGDLTDDGPPILTHRASKVTVNTRNPTAWNPDRRPVQLLLLDNSSANTPSVTIKFKLPENYEQMVEEGSLGLKAESAPIYFLGCPMEIGLLNNRGDLVVVTQPDQIKLYRGRRTSISSFVGTPSVGPQNRPAAIDFCTREAWIEAHKHPKEDRPMLRIEFPARPGEKPLVREIRLNGE